MNGTTWVQEQLIKGCKGNFLNARKMNLPRRIDDILTKKQALIDRYRDRLNNSVIRLQSDLFEKTIAELIPQLDVKDGVIQDTANNYKVIAQVDKLYDDFNKSVISDIFPEIVKGTEQIAALNNNIFSLVMARDLPPNFENVLTGTKKLMDARLGIDYSLSKGPRIVRGSYLYSILKDTGATEFKQLMLKGVTAQIPEKEFIRAIKENIVGGEEKYGSLTRKLRMYTYDLYQQYDAAYNVKLANEFGFTWFVYQGGLVVDSRDFCREHNNHVYNIDETESWKTWTPRDAVNITDFKQKDLDKVPSYIDYPGYDPLIDRGGYNCRHQLGFIPDDLAKKMRGEK